MNIAIVSKSEKETNLNSLISFKIFANSTKFSPLTCVIIAMRFVRGRFRIAYKQSKTRLPN